MNIFRLDPQKFSAFKRKTTLRSLIIFPVYGLIALIIHFGSEQQASNANMWIYLVFTFLLMGIFTVYSSRNQLKKFEALFRLRVDEDRIILQQFKLNDVQIAKEEISGIYAHTNGSFKITTNDPQKSINIHPCIEKEEELKILLENFAPIQPFQQKKYKIFVQYAMVVLVLAGMIAAFSFDNPWVAVPGGLIAAGYLVYAFVQIQKSNMVSKDIKQKSWWFILPFLALLFAVYSKLLL